MNDASHSEILDFLLIHVSSAILIHHLAEKNRDSSQAIIESHKHDVWFEPHELRFASLLAVVTLRPGGEAYVHHRRVHLTTSFLSAVLVSLGLGIPAQSRKPR